MDPDSDNESIEGEVSVDASSAQWGKTKHDYYYTDYVDKDYPSKLTAKEQRLAAIEQEEALRIQKKLLSTLSNVDLEVAYEDEATSQGDDQENLLDLIEKQNNLFSTSEKSKKRKRVSFKDHDKDNEDQDDDVQENGTDTEDDDDSDNIYDDDDGDVDGNDDTHNQVQGEEDSRKRRPINMAMKKNRGLTPYKKKEYRNPRVKHKLKYKKAMTKRRRNVKEAQIEYHRYSGESTGIKTSTIKSIKLC